MLEAIEASYTAADEDRRMLERAMDLTSKELTQHNEQLQEANERLLRANEVRRDFINAAAHELCTPLTPMKLQISTLRASLGKDVQSGLELLERNLDRIITLSRDLLDSARIQTGTLQLDAVSADAAQVARFVVEAQSALAHARGVRLDVAAEAEAPVAFDPWRLEQVLENLVNNAVKFSDPGGTVRVSVMPGDPAVIQVTDEGIGIEPRMLDELFQPFGHLHAVTEPARAGTGLGLYICKGIVDAAGGELRAASEGPGRGASFTLRLPGPG